MDSAFLSEDLSVPCLTFSCLTGSVIPSINLPTVAIQYIFLEYLPRYCHPVVLYAAADG